MKAENTLDVVEFLLAAFPRAEADEKTVAAYVALLDDLEPALLAKAAIAVAREHRYPGLPQVGEIRAKYAELADPEALTAEAGWEQLQVWGRSGVRSETSLDERVLAVCKTFGEQGAWLLTDPAADVTARNVQRSQFLRAWGDSAQRARRVEQAVALGELPGVNLGAIGNGGAGPSEPETCSQDDDGTFRCRPDPTKPPPILRMEDRDA